MLLREDNYNKHFRNGGAADRVLDVSGAIASSSAVSRWMDAAVNKRFQAKK